MRILAFVLLLVGVSLVADATAFEARYTAAALTTLDHGTQGVRQNVDGWLNHRKG